MVIGRTTEGLIKIKTDDPLGLRAVPCACCSDCDNECGILSVLIPESLRPLFDSATAESITMWGYPAVQLEPNESGGWFAYFFVNDGVFSIRAFLYYTPNGCLFLDDAVYETDYDPSEFKFLSRSNVYFGLVQCTAFSGVNGTFTVNGTDQFPWFYQTAPGLTSCPPPNITIS